MIHYVLCKFNGNQLIKRSHAIPTLEAAQELLPKTEFSTIRVLDNGKLREIIATDRTSMLDVPSRNTVKL